MAQPPQTTSNVLQLTLRPFSLFSAPPVAFLQNVNHTETRKHLSGPVPPRVSPTDVNTPGSEHGTVQWERKPHKKYGLFYKEGAKVARTVLPPRSLSHAK